MRKIVGIIYLGKISNTFSIQKALLQIGYNSELIKNFKKINSYNHIIIPGVGSFPEAMKELKKRKFDLILKNKNLKPKIMGICLGMQVFAKFGYEFKKTSGLNYYNAEIIKISFLKKLPNIGFFKIKFNKVSIFKNINNLSEFYFMHSYHIKKINKSLITSYITYKKYKIISSIKYKNFTGVQFHPEKSGVNGLKILSNFLNDK
jgi:glutamine amidotransferase